MVTKEPQAQFGQELENAYNAYTAHRHKNYIRTAYVVFVLLYGVFSVTDYILVPAWFSLFFAIRFYIVIPVFIFTVILSFHKNYYHWEQLVLLSNFIIGGAGIAVMLILVPLNSVYYGGLFLVLTAGYFMLHLRAFYAVTGGVTILVIFITGVLLTGNMSLTVFSTTLFLITENIVGSLGAYQLERFRRNEFFKMQELNHAQAQLENSIIERNRYLEAILQTSADGFMVVDADNKVVQVNDAYCRMSGYSRDELWHMKLDDLENDEISENITLRFHRLAKNGSEIFETRHRRKDGSVFDVEVSTTFHDLEEGQLVCFCRDITKRKQSDDRIRSLLAAKELFLKEVHHRIKNNFATISTLLDLQSQATPPEVRALFDVAINRVNSMVVLYDKLLSSEQYDSSSCKAFLEDILQMLLSFFPETVSVRLETQLDDFNLSAKKLFPLGIIVNEIVTNIMKYAFIGRNSGLIRISLVKVDDVATLTIQDNGVGLPEGFDLSRSTGFGLMLVGMLADQLDGTFTMQNNSGTKSVLEFGV